LDNLSWKIVRDYIEVFYSILAALFYLLIANL